MNSTWHAFWVLLLAASTAGQASSQDDTQGTTSPASERAASSGPFGRWSEQWSHQHFSPRGAPYVHLFSFEPAFFDRGLFFDYGQTRSSDGTEEETEFEVELEWAFTNWLGLVVEAPLVRVDSGEDSHTGIGDFAIAPRALLVQTDSFLLSANLELGMSTGDEDRGLGAGETSLAPSISLWADLGNWVSLQAQAGTEHGLESGDAELSYKSALTWTFLTSAAHDSESAHHPLGMTSLLTELTARTVLDGNEEKRTTAELLFGVSYSVSEHWQVRAGYKFPVGGTEEIDDSFVLGAIFHF
jgi:opacity protein-like surface antigen